MLDLITSTGQEAEKAQEKSVEAQTLGQWLYEFCSEPGVIEILLSVVIVVTVVFSWWRLAALVKNARAREALLDYLLGVEQAMQGNLVGAEKRLSRVLQQDPENHYARLLLGKVLGDLGQAEQAHQQHLYLQRAFQVESGDNDLMLAQSLLAAGLPIEAAEVAERALERMPQNTAGWDFVYRARLQNGDQEAAARAGKKLLSLLRDGPERDRMRVDLARTLAEVGTLHWLKGDRRTALQSAKEVEGLDATMQQLPLLSARLEAQEHGVEQTARQLSAVQTGGSLVVAGEVADAVSTSSCISRSERSSGQQLPMATFEGLLESTRWSCTACGGPLQREVAQCPRCSAADSAGLVEPKLVATIESPTEAMDRIDVNEAHVQRLVRSLAAGDRSSHDELLHLGERAVEEVLRVAWKSSGTTRDLAIDVLRAMGPTIAPALFRASDLIGQQRLLSVGPGPEVIVSRIVQGFDRSALPHMQSLFASSRPDHRRILIDYFLGLGDVEAFQSVLERFPPMEILHRFNNADPEVLQRFLQAIPRGHFVADSLLLEHTFYRDDALLAAVPESNDPEVLVAVMLARGPTRALTTALIHGVADDRLAATSQRVLEELGEQVIEHVLAGYADPDSDETTQKRLSRVLVRGGAAAAAHIADSFGPEATLLDDRLRELLVIIGDPAVEPMVAAYERSGWLEKVSVGLIRRLNNRRVQIASALSVLGTKPATKALKVLHKREKDDNLRLHLSRALHGRSGSPEGGSNG
ncbi:MAG: tetratricopeptide (TPR) repeat protein [Planctomycetota bacterium]